MLSSMAVRVTVRTPELASKLASREYWYASWKPAVYCAQPDG